MAETVVNPKMIDALNEQISTIETRLVSTINPIASTIKPYGNYAPVANGVIATSYDMAIENGILYIRAYDSNGTQIKIFYVQLGII